MTTVIFILTMPGVNSWNGRWSGEEHLYCISRGFPSSKAGQERVKKFMGESEEKAFGHNFGDGWRARVTARIVRGVDAKRMLKKSKGFCGYDWMVDSIVRHGAIYAEEPKEVKA